MEIIDDITDQFRTKIKNYHHLQSEKQSADFQLHYSYEHGQSDLQQIRATNETGNVD